MLFDKINKNVKLNVHMNKDEDGSAVLLIFALIVSIVAGLQVVEITKADSKTITVPDDYPTIQQAINNALAGDTVYVKSGTYSENLIITKSLSLVGENKDSTIIVGSGNTACLIQHDNVNVTGFTFRRLSTMRWHYNIHLLNVKHCNVFENNWKVLSMEYGLLMPPLTTSLTIQQWATGMEST